MSKTSKQRQTFGFDKEKYVERISATNDFFTGEEEGKKEKKKTIKNTNGLKGEKGG